jgi:hypothetical protein
MGFHGIHVQKMAMLAWSEGKNFDLTFEGYPLDFCTGQSRESVVLMKVAFKSSRSDLGSC